MEAFVAGVRGAVLRAGDAGYDEARAIWNGLIDRRPALIVQCTGAADVVDAVNFAREHDLVLSVRGGGHNVAGNAVNDGGLVIDLSAMRGVHVDPSTQTVRAAGRRDLGRLRPRDAAVRAGGAGRRCLDDRRRRADAARRYRATCAASTDCRSTTCSRSTSSPPTGSCAGRARPRTRISSGPCAAPGSNFGVVTSFEFQAHPVGPMVMVGAVMYPLEDVAGGAARLARLHGHGARRAQLDRAPLDRPAGRAVPAGAARNADRARRRGLLRRGRGRRAGRAAAARARAAAARHVSGPWPWLGLQSGFDALFPKGGLYYWKSRALAELTDEAIEEIADFAARRPSPLTDIVIWHHGGAMSRVRRVRTPRTAAATPPFLVTGEASWTDPADTDEAIAWGREFWAAMEPHSTGGIYLNFPGLGEEKEALVRAGYGANYERLAALKAKYDPDEPLPHEPQHHACELTTGATSVAFIGKAASFTVVSNGQLRATVPCGREERTDPRRHAPGSRAGGPHGTAGPRASAAQLPLIENA